MVDRGHRTEPTEEDLIAALLQAQAKPVAGRPPGFMRRVEIEEALGISAQKVYDMLHALNAQGRLVCRRVQAKSDLTGERITIQAYALKEVQDDAGIDSDDSGRGSQLPG